MLNLFKRKPKQMSFDEFVERAQRIVPIDYSVFCEIKRARYNLTLNERQETTYTLSILIGDFVEIFSSNCPEKTLSKLKNYFDTL